MRLSFSPSHRFLRPQDLTTRWLAAFALLSIGAGSADASGRIGERCRGTETVQVAGQPPKMLPYAVTFSADLVAKRYCYDRCRPDQTYPLIASDSHRITLADNDHGGQSRHLIFDRGASVLTDDQSFDAGLGRIVRHVSATCRPASFHQPGHEGPR